VQQHPGPPSGRGLRRRTASKEGPDGSSPVHNLCRQDI
jgi:hypothetical protein